MAGRYHTQVRSPSQECLGHQGVRQDTAIEAIKATVQTLDLADLLCGPAGNRSGLHRIGDKWVGKCPLPDCASRLPSFAVWPETDAWWCFSCMRGGGATALARLAGHALVAKARGKCSA